MTSIPEIPGYRIEKELGKGGMSIVYLGVQENLNREVAIKVLSPDMFKDQNFLRRFLNEAHTASRLSHPNIVTIHDVGQLENHCFIVMERLHESLVDRLKLKPDSRLSPIEAFKIIRQVAGALVYAHEEGFIHRDIKPDNILFRKDLTPVLVDFGIARALHSQSQLTTTGAIIGTPHYMSPEQCRGEQIDGQSDIYSLGIVLYEILTGDVPYKADSAAGVLLKHVHSPIPQLPPELQKFQPLIDKMVAKKKDERVHNGTELIRLLDTFTPDSRIETIKGIRDDAWVFDDSSRKKTKPEDQSTEKFRIATRHSPYQSTILLPKTKSKGPLIITFLTIPFILVAAYFIFFHNQFNSNASVKETQHKETREEKQSIVSPKKVSEEKEFLKYFILAKDAFKNGNYKKAKKNIKEAKKFKTTEELEKIAHAIGGIEKRREEKAKKTRKEAARRKRLQQQDTKAYTRAVSRNTIYSYEKYLQNYPKGRHSKEAKKKYEELKKVFLLEERIKDDTAYESAAKTNSIPPYEDYLKKYPKGHHTLEARTRIEQLKTKIIKGTKIKLSLQYVRFFESGSKAPPVGQRNYKTRFQKQKTRYIYTEIAYNNKFYRIADTKSRVTLVYSNSNQSFRQELEGSIDQEKGARTGIYWRGIGWSIPGKWQPGIYIITIYVEGREVSQSRIEIYSMSSASLRKVIVSSASSWFSFVMAKPA